MMTTKNASMGALRRSLLHLVLLFLSQTLGAQAACTTLTTCASDEVEVQGPTWTSDRVCARVAPTTTAAPEPEVVVVSTAAELPWASKSRSENTSRSKLVLTPLFFQYANTIVVSTRLTLEWTADVSEGRTYFRADFAAEG